MINASQQKQRHFFDKWLYRIRRDKIIENNVEIYRRMSKMMLEM